MHIELCAAGSPRHRSVQHSGYDKRVRDHRFNFLVRLRLTISCGRKATRQSCALGAAFLLMFVVSIELPHFIIFGGRRARRRLSVRRESVARLWLNGGSAGATRCAVATLKQLSRSVVAG
jgi:hypothetical protein